MIMGVLLVLIFSLVANADVHRGENPSQGQASRVKRLRSEGRSDRSQRPIQLEEKADLNDLFAEMPDQNFVVQNQGDSVIVIQQNFGNVDISGPCADLDGASKETQELCKKTLLPKAKDPASQVNVSVSIAVPSSGISGGSGPSGIPNNSNSGLTPNFFDSKPSPKNSAAISETTPSVTRSWQKSTSLDEENTIFPEIWAVSKSRSMEAEVSSSDSLPPMTSPQTHNEDATVESQNGSSRLAASGLAASGLAAREVTSEAAGVPASGRPNIRDIGGNYLHALLWATLGLIGFLLLRRVFRSGIPLAAHGLNGFQTYAPNSFKPLLDLSDNQAGMPKTTPPFDKHRIYVKYHARRKKWILIRLDSRGNLSEEVGELKPGTVVNGSVLGRTHAQNFKLEPNGEWVPTADNEQYLILFKGMKKGRTP